MKFAVLSDIHSNYPALKAVYEDSKNESVDGYIILGDLIGLMGYTKETVELIKEISTYCIKGNHDFAVINKNEGHVNSKELSNFELQLANELPVELKNWISNMKSYKEVIKHNLLLAHAYPSPEHSTGYESGNSGVKKRNYTRLASEVDDSKFDFVLLGHTHVQGAVDARKFSQDVTILNPGSVGQPLHKPAEYAIINTKNKTHKLKTVEYDYEEVKQTLVDKNVPIKWWEQKPKKTYRTRHV